MSGALFQVTLIPSLVLYSQGLRHIAYSGNGLYYTHWTGAEWQFTYVSGPHPS